jgi:hypothetical protein
LEVKPDSLQKITLIVFDASWNWHLPTCPLVIILLSLALLLGILVKRWGIEGPSEVVALDRQVLGAWVPWPLLLQEFLELLLRCTQLLASWGVLNSRDDVIWLVFSRRSCVVPLASVVVVVIPPLVVIVVVIVALREAIVLLLLLVYQSLHHVVEPRDRLGSIAAKVSKESLVSDAVEEAVDNILLEDVGDGGMCVEETASVGL